MKLSNYTLIDTVTGTILDPSSCVLVPDSALTGEELDSASDSEITEIGKELGKPLTCPLDYPVVSALGDLLEQAQERLDKALHMLDEEDAQREMDALDKLWAHYQQLLG